MQKLILLLSIMILSINNSHSCEFLVRNVYCINNNNFSNQNQILASWFKTGWKNLRNDNLQMYNVSIGLRTNTHDNPRPVGKLILYQKNGIIPFEANYNNTENYEDKPLKPTGDRSYTFWNRLGNATVLNIDMSDFEEIYIKWVQIQQGLGFDTRNLDKSDNFLYHAFISGKLGLSSITYGDINFKNMKDNLSHNVSLETGLKFISGISYKRNFICEPFFDYIFYIAENFVHKISCGISNEYYLYIPIDSHGSYGDLIKFSFGANYNKYYFEKFEKEFLKFDFGIEFYPF